MANHDNKKPGTAPSTGEGRAALVRSTMTAAPAPGRPGSPADALEVLPELARQLLNADYAAVTVLDQSGRVTRMIYAGMTDAEAAAIGEPPRGIGLLGRLGSQDRPLRVAHIKETPGSSGFPGSHPEMDALLGVKVFDETGSSANLYVANGPSRPPFSWEEEKKLSSLATFASIALENFRLLGQERNLRTAAEAAEQRLTAVIRGSTAGVIVKDASDGRIIEASSEVRRITGIELPGDLQAGESPFESIYHTPSGVPISRDEIPINAALEQRTPIGPTEMLFVRPDGSRLPVLVSAAPVFDSYGELDSAICVFVDVTGLKAFEQAKDDFLSMITHDLRTPLATIKGMAAAALEAATDGDSESAISLLEPIDDEVDYLAELVSNLLDMTRIEAGADVFEMEVCHLADIAQDSLARISRSRDAQGRVIHHAVPPDLPAIYADPRQVGRVMDNLLSNALKYSAGDVRLSARSHAPGRGVVVDVIDDGPGIPEDQREVVFDRFARVRRKADQGRQGSGLGLAICKSIVTAHSGKIGVVPERNGSRFWFMLPADTGTASAGDDGKVR